MSTFYTDAIDTYNINISVASNYVNLNSSSINFSSIDSFTHLV